MAYFRFNCEGSATEAPARFAATESEGLVHLKVGRQADTLLLTMTNEQAANLSLLLRNVSNAPTSRPLRRSRLAPYDR